MKTILLILLLCISMQVLSQNPIVPPGLYMADPAAQVWEDGRLYLYCSVDEEGNWYCSRKYHVLSTEDMLDWELHQHSFASEGEMDEVSYNDDLLFAPDCMYNNGTYYLYYCQPDKDNAEGVAVSKNPAGPFKDGIAIDIGDYNQIDPGVFMDDDGEIYYIWGQFTLKMARLKSNMLELQEGSIIDSVLTESEHFFHEGAFMTKRGGQYYLVYADMSRGNTPTCLGYATSKNPTGPYTYRGVIIDNDHCDPQSWNNHGSIAEYNDQWYVFYHRSTHGSRMMRKACVEAIEFLEDGSIPEVEMTSQGAGAALDAYSVIDGASACWMFGNVRIEQVGPANEALTKAKHDDRAVIRYVDFGEGASTVDIRVRPGKVAGSLQLNLDYPWRNNIANIEIPKDQDDGKWITYTADVKNARGIHALWLKFTGDQETGEFGCSVDELIFK